VRLHVVTALKRLISDYRPFLFLPTHALFFLYITFPLPLVPYFIMPKASDSSSFSCNLTGCGRVFNSKQGLAVHQRTCITKQVDREQVARYEAEVQAERTRLESEGLNFRCSVLSLLCNLLSESVADPPPVRRQRVWEDPLFRKRINTVAPVFVNCKW
jgi:hypothetical protein